MGTVRSPEIIPHKRLAKGIEKKVKKRWKIDSSESQDSGSDLD